MPVWARSLRRTRDELERLGDSVDTFIINIERRGKVWMLWLDDGKRVLATLRMMQWHCPRIKDRVKCVGAIPYEQKRLGIYYRLTKDFKVIPFEEFE